MMVPFFKVPLTAVRLDGRVSTSQSFAVSLTNCTGEIYKTLEGVGRVLVEVGILPDRIAMHCVAVRERFYCHVVDLNALHHQLKVGSLRGERGKAVTHGGNVLFTTSTHYSRSRHRQKCVAAQNQNYLPAG